MAALLNRLLLLLSFWLIGCIVANSQNLVPNPDFEAYLNCPDGYGPPFEAAQWQPGNLGSPDYYNVCTTIEVGVPDNAMGYEFAHSGVGYTGLFARIENNDYHEYIKAQLTEPLVAGVTYHVMFYVSLAEVTCGSPYIGAYFSATPPPANDHWHLDLDPQVEHVFGMITNYNGWIPVSGCFIAEGGESWITIGTFYHFEETPTDPLCTAPFDRSYFYIDDVSVVAGPPPEEIPLDLGEDLSICTEYLIDPEAGNFAYSWSDGSHEPTLTVTTSGLYFLTISDGCNVGVDSIEVIIEGTPFQVEMGPSEVILCPGDSYTVSLDPAFNYEWHDGSTDPDYVISTTGLYQVTMYDGCDASVDEMIVTVIDPPAPFTLGVDTHLCPGDVVEYNFDPALGTFTWQDNSASSSYTIDEPGMYALTISNVCGAFMDEITVVAIEPPEIQLGEPQLDLCLGDTIILAPDPAQGNYLWQDGTTNPSYTISQEGLYSVTVSNFCGSADDQIFVNIIQPPLPDLGEDVVICPAQLPFTLNAENTPFATEYLWQNGSMSDVFDVVIEGTYSLTVSNDCFSVTDEILVTVEDAGPIAVLPPDTSLCPGDTVIIMHTGSTGDYLWQDFSTADHFLATMPGTYSLTITNFCGTASDSIMIGTQPEPIPPNLGPDFSICPGETFILYALSPGSVYEWQDMSSADSLVGVMPGTYFVQASNVCGSASDTVTVSVNNNPPTLDLPAQLSLCQGQSITLDAGISGVSYLWSDNSQNQQLLVSTPGTYSLFVSNACGADQDTVIILDGGPAPVVSLGNDMQLCPGDHFVLSPAFSNVDTWLWHDGSVLPTFDVSNAGVVHVAVSNACGVAFDTLLVNLLPAVPPLDLGPDTSLCPGHSFTLSISTPDVSVLWPDGSTEPDFVIASAGDVLASISNTCGTSSDTLSVEALPDIPALDLGPDQALCPGETIIIDPGISEVDYLWHDGSVSTSYQTTQQGTIILTITNACGASVDTVEIIESTEGPQVDLGPDIQECEGAIVNIPSGISGVNYLWHDGSTNPDFTATQSGVIILQVNNNCGTDSDTITVDISGVHPTVALGPDTTICEGTNLVLVSYADAITSIQWQDGSASSSFIVTTPGLYSLAESNRCGDDADSIVVSYLDAPDPFTLGSDTILCPGEFITLTAPFTAFDILWQNGSTLESIIADQPITYALQLSNACGVVTDDLLVSFDTHIPVIDLGPDLDWCNGDVFTLDASQSFFASYSWSTGSNTPFIEITTPGVYSVEVNTYCHQVADEVTVSPGVDCITAELHKQIFIPNVFSPNGDGINDVFIVNFGQDLEVVSMTGSVYDRWGNLVYSSEDISFTWDGYFNDKAVMPGVYVYIINVNYLDQGMERVGLFSGNVTLVR